MHLAFSPEACEKFGLCPFFANWDEGFYECDIMKSPSKWQEVIEKPVHI